MNRFDDLSFMFRKGASGGPFADFSPEYQAVLLAAQVQGINLPSLEVMSWQDEHMRAVRDGVSWPNIDAYYVFLNDIADDISRRVFCSINWKNPSGQGTYGNNVEVTNQLGLNVVSVATAGSGFSSELNSITTAHWQQESASMGAYCLENFAPAVGNGGNVFDGSGIVNDTYLAPRGNGDLLRYGVNTGKGVDAGVANSDSSGCWGVNRVGDGFTRAYRGGVLKSQEAIATAGVCFSFRLLQLMSAGGTTPPVGVYGGHVLSWLIGGGGVFVFGAGTMSDAMDQYKAHFGL